MLRLLSMVAKTGTITGGTGGSSCVRAVSVDRQQEPPVSALTPYRRYRRNEQGNSGETNTAEEVTTSTAGPGGWLSQYARRKKLEYFLGAVPRDAAILEVGCGNGTAKRWAEGHGYRVVGLDLRAPADIVGDVNEWRALGLAPHSFDVILAFEVIEHGDLAKALHDLIKPDGVLMLTTPVPRMDWACKLMESAGILQRRTGEHTHLVDIRRYPHFRVVERRIRGLVSQWGILAPVHADSP